MATANNPNNNLSPWKPGQSGNPSGRPRGTRDLAGYVLETTDGGKELVDALVSIARGAVPNLAVQKGSRPRKYQQVRPKHYSLLVLIIVRVLTIHLIALCCYLMIMFAVGIRLFLHHLMRFIFMYHKSKRASHFMSITTQCCPFNRVSALG